MKVKHESERFAVVEFPRADVATPEDALSILEKIADMKLVPLHRMEGAYGNCFACLKEDDYEI